jgi:hypothetical protein
MMNVESAAFLSGLITTFIANVGSVTFVGWFRALVASKMGDDTAERMGFLSLNPMAHVDIFFMISFMLFGIGLGQYPFVDETRIAGPFAKLKFYCVYFLNTALYLFFSISALALLLIFFGQSILKLFAALPHSDGVSYAQVMKLYPELSSLSFSFALIGIAVVHINSLLAVFSFFINALRLFFLPLLNYLLQDVQHKEVWVIVGAITLMYIGLEPLRRLALGIIFGAGYALAGI